MHQVSFLSRRFPTIQQQQQPNIFVDTDIDNTRQPHYRRHDGGRKSLNNNTTHHGGFISDSDQNIIFLNNKATINHQALLLKKNF
jgi:hypothetical protein